MEDPNSISATSGGDDNGGDGAGSDKEGILDKDWILVDTDKAVDKGMFMVLDGGGSLMVMSNASLRDAAMGAEEVSFCMPVRVFLLV